MTGEDGLSRREEQIARAYATGESYRAIGERLFIAPSTVRTHLATIYRKLGVTSKLDLARALGTLGADPLASAVAAAGPARSTVDVGEPEHGRLAVMPFTATSPAARALGAALVQDVITRLAKMRSVRVIARGTVFALEERGIRGREAADLIGADYLASGDLTEFGSRIRVSVELTERGIDTVLWAETFDCPAADPLVALQRIGDILVSALAAGVEMAERNRAILRNPQSLDAWTSFHRGLWHMYRFNAADNQSAQELFRRAVRLDPTFARAWSGLSFTHFQNAFLLTPEHRAVEIGRAMEAAGESVVADERDPSAHWALGRALWLKGEIGQANAALGTAVDISPSFALGHYAIAFVNSQSGDPGLALGAADVSEGLSPFDPMLFGFHGARAMAHFRLGAYAEAAEDGLKAAMRPNAHAHIFAIAAHCLAMADRLDEARRMLSTIRAVNPGYSSDDFQSAFRFPAADVALFREAAARIGLE